MKLSKEDILIVRERIEDGEIIEEIPHVKAIRLDKLREVVKHLCSKRQGDERGFGWVKEIDIYEVFGEVIENV